jgi:hypothetical protein
LAAHLVAGRLAWCAVLALRARRKQIAAISITGMLCIVALFGAAVAVWFGYGVAHTHKDMSTFLTVFFITVPPYFLALFGIWLVDDNLHSRLRSGVARQGPAADAVRPNVLVRNL